MPETPSDPEISLIEAIHKRRSVRGFLDKEIDPQTLNRIFEIVQLTPSNCNVQPWQVLVAGGKTRDRLRTAMLKNFDADVPARQDYEYRGDFLGAHRQRQVDCAVELYNNMGIERHDKEGRRKAVRRNYEFFDAPYMAFLGMASGFGTTVALDVGMYAQSLMLTLVAFGMHSCPMGSMRNYPDLVREAFGLDKNVKILMGLAFGYEDTNIPANRTRVGRAPVSENVIIRM